MLIAVTFKYIAVQTHYFSSSDELLLPPLPRRAAVSSRTAGQRDGVGISAQRGNPSSTLGWKPELLGVRQGDVVAARLLLAGTEKA